MADVKSVRLFGRTPSKAPIAVNFNYAAITWGPYGASDKKPYGPTPLVCIFKVTCSAVRNSTFIYPVGSTNPVLLSEPADILVQLSSLTGSSNQLHNLLSVAQSSFVNINVNPLTKPQQIKNCGDTVSAFTYPIRLQQCHLQQFDYNLGGTQGNQIVTLDTPVKLVCAKIFYRSQQLKK